MTTQQRWSQRFATCVIVGILGLPEISAGAERNADALPPGVVARLGWSPLRIGYADFVLTPDGRAIIAVTPQGNLRRLDAKTGRLLECRQLSDRSDVDLGADPTVHRAVLSANGETVALYEASYAGPRLSVYDIASGKMIFRRASTEKRVLQSGILSPDGKQLAVSEEEDIPQDTVIPDKKITKQTYLRLFDLKSGRMRQLGAFPQGTLGIFFSADSKRLLAAQQDIDLPLNILIHLDGQPAPHALTVFDLPSGKKLWRRTVWAQNYALSRDGTTVLAAGCSQDCEALHLDFRLRGNNRATGFHVLQMDLEAKKLTERFIPCQLDPDMANFRGIIGFMLAPDDRSLVISYFGGHDTAYIVSWDLRTRKEIRRLKLPQPEGAQLLPPEIALAADGRTLLTKREYLQRWDLTIGKSFFTPPANGLPDYPVQLAWTPDGKQMLACSDQGFVCRWNTATGKRFDLRRDSYDRTPFIRTSSGLRAVHYVNQDKIAEFTVLDPIAQKNLRTFRWDRLKSPSWDSHVETYSLTANGKTILAVHEKRVTAWDVATGRQLSDFAVTANGSFAVGTQPFSPCGRWMLLGDKVHYTGSGSELFGVGGTSEESLVSVNPMQNQAWYSDDGRLLAVCYRKNKAISAAENALVVWELASAKILARFDRVGFIAQAAFAPDGSTIALLDAQGVRLLDLLDGKQRAKYAAPDVVSGSAAWGRDMQTLVFAPDGHTLATGHQDGTILIWKVPQARNDPAAALTDGEADKLWKDLGSASPVIARTAVERLARHADAASTLLEKRFCPPPTDAKLIALINDLDSELFSRREQASRKVRDYGAKAESALRGRLAKGPSLEMRRRIENILAEMAPPSLRLPLSGERLRGARAIEVLERIGNAAARSLLQSWAEQTEDVHLALEARMAFERR